MSRRNEGAAMRTFVAVGIAGVLACSRTPPEPQPVASTTSPPVAPTVAPRAAAAGDATTSAATRCIAPLASAAPRIPAVASPPACPPDPEGPQHLPVATVAFPEAGGVKVDVEIAKTPHDIERGLMYRRAMPEEHGMLFKLDERREHTFWMHNTCLPLDMLFVDDDGVVVGIVEAAEPLTDTTRSVGCPSTFVLEVNAGWSRRHGVKPGQRMGIPPAAR
jgi:hypothetical protein